MSRKDGVKDKTEKIKSLEEAKAVSAQAGKKLTDDEVSKAVGGANLRGMPPRRTELITCPYCTKLFTSDQYITHVVACRMRERIKQEENNESPDSAIPGKIDLF